MHTRQLTMIIIREKGLIPPIHTSWYRAHKYARRKKKNQEHACKPTEGEERSQCMPRTTGKRTEGAKKAGLHNVLPHSQRIRVTRIEEKSPYNTPPPRTSKSHHTRHTDLMPKTDEPTHKKKPIQDAKPEHSTAQHSTAKSPLSNER